MRFKLLPSWVYLNASWHSFALDKVCTPLSALAQGSTCWDMVASLEHASMEQDGEADVYILMEKLSVSELLFEQLAPVSKTRCAPDYIRPYHPSL